MEKPQQRQFKYLFEESYLLYIKNGVGSKMFRSFLVIDEKGKKQDILGNGDVSCGIFLSTILRNFGLIQKLHFTVSRTIDDIVACKWKKVPLSAIKPGDVILWEPKKGRTGFHTHAGFYIGNKMAVSNSSSKRMIAKHHYTYNAARKIVAVYRPNWKQVYAKS